VRFIPINYFRRKGGHSTFHPIKDTYSLILLVVRTVMYFNPLRVLLPVAFVLSGLGFIKMSYDFIKYQHIGGFDASLFLSGVMVGVAGFLADLLVMLNRKAP
jgi:hypothetical protein